eukprot:4054148-Pyramimonas_sp.AAC.1
MAAGATAAPLPTFRIPSSYWLKHRTQVGCMLAPCQWDAISQSFAYKVGYRHVDLASGRFAGWATALE